MTLRNKRNIVKEEQQQCQGKAVATMLKMRSYIDKNNNDVKRKEELCQKK